MYHPVLFKCGNELGGSKPALTRIIPSCESLISAYLSGSDPDDRLVVDLKISFFHRRIDIVKDVLLNAALRKDVLRKDFGLKGSENPGEISLCGFLFRAAAGTAQNAEIFALSGQLEEELFHTRLVEIPADLQAESDHT